MKQAETLMTKGVYKEAEQLYSRVHDIVASFSPANSPMMDAINRKLLFHSLLTVLGNCSSFTALVEPTMSKR